MGLKIFLKNGINKVKKVWNKESQEVEVISCGVSELQRCPYTICLIHA